MPRAFIGLVGVGALLAGCSDSAPQPASAGGSAAALTATVTASAASGAPGPGSASSPPPSSPLPGSPGATTAPSASGTPTSPLQQAAPVAAARPGEWINPASSGQTYGSTVPGLLTFRGNPTRTFYGTGPIPRERPAEAWRYPSKPMCASSSVGSESKIWCGTGWTGQPAVFERNGRTWVVFGAYDRKVHFVDAETGKDILPAFATGDIIKGSVTIDPDGFPLVYSGSRDNNYRVIAVDGDRPRELWKLAADAVKPVLWNNDWDGAGLIVDDYLFEGGENGQIHIVKLNRSYGPDGRVRVDPKLVFNAPSWDSDLLADIGDQQVSVENSVAISGNTLYFASSGGLVQGWDISGLRDGQRPRRTFRFWTGDDTDASVVVDEEGMLYVGSQWERHTARGRQVGQIMKLDPSKPDPLVWGVKDQGSGLQGVWATPGLWRDLVIVPTTSGRLLGLDRATGQQRWVRQMDGQTWQSPVIVDDVLLQGDCSGTLRAYDLAASGADGPPELWRHRVAAGCIESTPAVWNGRIYLGTRAGYLHAIAARP